MIGLVLHYAFVIHVCKADYEHANQPLHDLACRCMFMVGLLCFFRDSASVLPGSCCRASDLGRLMDR